MKNKRGERPAGLSPGPSGLVRVRGRQGQAAVREAALPARPGGVRLAPAGAARVLGVSARVLGTIRPPLGSDRRPPAAGAPRSAVRRGRLSPPPRRP